MSCYYGMMRLGRRGAGATLRLDNASYSDELDDPFNASCTLTIANSGFLTASGTFGDSYAWCSGGDPSDFEVKATVTVGTFSSGTAGSWLALSSSQSWNVFRGSPGSKSCAATFELREAAVPGTILKSASITLEAIVDA